MPDCLPDPLTLRSTGRLTGAEQAAVDTLVEAAAAADGVLPLSEQSWLAVHGRSGQQPSHLLGFAGPRLVGYAQVVDGSAELVVAPGRRRQGIGSTLLAALPAGTRVWAHGDQPAAEAFAAASGQSVVRELWVLGRRFDENPPLPDAVLPAGLPAGLVARRFLPGRDEREWLRVNALAFASHAEQGRMTRADLDARMAEPWFDPDGLLLVVPKDDPDRVAGFHWTKIHGEDRKPSGAAKGSAPKGEVYVVGVDPAYQGRGLGAPLTLLGLHHLRSRGVADVLLYVDGDNPAALKVYRGLGFTTRSVDRMYAAQPLT